MFKKTRSPLYIFIVLALVLGACGGGARNEEYLVDEALMEREQDGAFLGLAAPAEASAPLSKQAGGFFNDGGSNLNQDTIVNANAQERIVIKNADLSLVVKNPASALREISGMAESLGGFVVNSNLYQTYTPTGKEVPAGSVTIRVPADQFTKVLDQLVGGAIEVQHKTINGRDVTLEYTDLQSRLRNLDDTAEQLRVILTGADETEEILAVYNQLTYVNEQAELIRGQLKYYAESAAFSAISINLVPEAVLQPVTIGGWEPVGVARDAVQALVNTLQNVTDVVIWVVIYILPIAVLVYLPAAIIRKIWVSRRTKQTVAAAD